MVRFTKAELLELGEVLCAIAQDQDPGSATVTLIVDELRSDDGYVIGWAVGEGEHTAIGILLTSEGYEVDTLVERVPLDKHKCNLTH